MFLKHKRFVGLLNGLFMRVGSATGVFSSQARSLQCRLPHDAAVARYDMADPAGWIVAADDEDVLVDDSGRSALRAASSPSET